MLKGIWTTCDKMFAPNCSLGESGYGVLASSSSRSDYSFGKLWCLALEVVFILAKPVGLGHLHRRFWPCLLHILHSRSSHQLITLEFSHDFQSFNTCHYIERGYCPSWRRNENEMIVNINLPYSVLSCDSKGEANRVETRNPLAQSISCR